MTFWKYFFILNYFISFYGSLDHIFVYIFSLYKTNKKVCKIKNDNDSSTGNENWELFEHLKQEKLSNISIFSNISDIF